MSQLFVITTYPDPETGEPTRRLEVTATEATFQGPVIEPTGTFTRTRRRCLTFFVRGTTGGKQTRVILHKPATGPVGPLWKGEQHPCGPLDFLFVVDDPASEKSGDVVDALGNPFNYEFDPCAPDGTPIGE